jgi:hypothetical protein
MGRVKAAFAVLLAAVGLSLAPAGLRAAVAFEISTERAHPLVGDPVAILVATFRAGLPADIGGLEPLPLDEFPWTFVADSPSGRSFIVPLTRDPGSLNRWVGHFTFDEAGRWQIGLAREHLGTPIDPSLGARRDAVVLGDRDQVTGWIVPLAIGALIGLGLLGLAGMAWLRNRQRVAG